MGNATDRPDEVLPTFDVVFALGRSALEALACGCAVIIADPLGIEELVTTESFARQHAANLGFALVVGRPVIRDNVAAKLKTIDIDEVARTKALVRQVANIEHAVDRWEELYRLAIAEGPASPAELLAGAARFLVQMKRKRETFDNDLRTAYRTIEKQGADHAIALGNMRAELEIASAAAKAKLKAEMASAMAQINAELAAARSHLDSTLASRSWRITRPFRAIRRFGSRRPG